jgi:tellurite resistance protein
VPTVPTVPSPTSPLKFLYPGWYAVVMGLTGLSLAWHRAVPVLQDAAGAVSLVLGVVAAAVFALLLVLTLLRGLRHADAWREDRQHPVRHTFIAALPIAAMLVATVAVALLGPGVPALALWWVGSLGQLFVTVWVLGRWWGKPVWATLTPALFIPVVGNVLAPLAGVPLGQGTWAAAQFGIGLLFWPVVLVLLMVRVLQAGAWPERLAPTVFIGIAPPAVVALSALQFDAPPLLVWMLWGTALFMALWSATLLRRIAALPFGMPHWGMSFPLAALAALTLALAGRPEAPAALGALGLALLALASLLVLALVGATLRGLRDGSLLAPEPVAPLVAAAGAPGSPGTLGARG